MCAALWTRNLGRGLPATLPDSGPADESGAAPAVCPAATQPTSDRVAYWRTRESPFGPLHLAATTAGVCAVALDEAADRFAARLARAGWRPTVADRDGPAAATLRAASEQLAEYFAGRRQTFDLPLDLRAATVFDRRVLAAMAAIPYGETRSYGELARTIGSPRAARAVGHACGRNPVPLLLPCHRVVRSSGALAGFGAGGIGVKAALLALEQRGAAC